MAGARPSRAYGSRVGGWASLLTAVPLLLLSVSPTAHAFDAFEGRLQAHGFFESQLRALNSDFSEDWDVSQWYMVFNLELELDLIQDTIGPIDQMSAFVRAEVRYDCIYSRGCGMFRSMDTYGDRSKSLPRRLNDRDRVRHSGRIRVPNDPTQPDKFREFEPGRGTSTDPLTALNDPVLRIFANGAGGDTFDPRETCDLGTLCTFLAGGTSAPAVWPDDDTPYPAIARAGGYADFAFISPGDQTGLGPWLPKNFFQTNATGASFGNLFDSRATSYALQAGVYNVYLIATNDTAPLFDAAGVALDAAGTPDGGARLLLVLDAATNGETGVDHNGNGATDDTGGLAARGVGALPFRPAPLRREDGAGVGQAIAATEARGLFIPSFPLARELDGGDLKGIEGDYNFNESQRAWNRGASQKDEKELKEAYLDIETFDNRLWLRIGKQQIVWGKTELFRTTDQFNPQDLALASLPSLEESRIALWSLRAVWSFYEVGVFDDVRLELAFNFDDYQQSDLGACGEPYTPNLGCQLTFGAFAHGVFGFGVAGVEEPPSPWQSLKGWEVGARLEWRYDRFSFALVDFYGYDDLPTLKQISTYTRNVDPRSGRPREIFSTLRTRSPGGGIVQVGTQGPCTTGAEPACLNGLKLLNSDGANDFVASDFNRDGTIDGIAVTVDPTTGLGTVTGEGTFVAGPESEALTRGAVAQQVFAFTCATTVGFSNLDPAACGLNIFGSSAGAPGVIPITIGQGIGSLLSGAPVVTQATQGTEAGSPMGEPTGFGGFALPFVALNAGADDLDNAVSNGEGAPCMDRDPINPQVPRPCGGEGGGILTAVAPGDTLGATLGPEQEALLGCGPFWGTQCDDSGIDLLNAEGSALFQSWPGLEGTVQNGDISIPWLTNQRVISPVTGQEVFAQQPGTRGWYFDRTRSHEIGPVCTTANFGGALFADSADAQENDSANGNQTILPGCRRKYKNDPDLPEFAGNNALLALNLYGQDLTCARERVTAANGGAAISAACTGLGDTDSPRVDPRSWELRRDGEPDGIGIETISPLAGPPFFMPETITPPARDVGTVATPQLLVVPDYFYTPGTTASGDTTFQAANRPLGAFPAAFGAAFDNCDRATIGAAVPELVNQAGGVQFVPCGSGGHPLTGQPFASEMAALSWNFLVLVVEIALQTEFNDAVALPANAGRPPADIARELFFRTNDCSIVNPGLCEAFRVLQGTIGLQRNVRKAGGNGAHGRRTFAWQSGGEAILTYEKRNVLGFSMDFAEDFTKANFSAEFTWIEGVPVANRNHYDDSDKADDFNLTISADRPTFINFLNSNRTFFFNWQFFMRYRDGWSKGFTDEGPWSFLTTFAVSTGYFQDRLTPNLTAVYDISTQSGALLTGVGYRFTPNFRASIGLAFFFGTPDTIDEPLAGLAPAANRSTAALDDIYKSSRFGGLAVVKDRDEIFARLRYTF